MIKKLPFIIGMSFASHIYADVNLPNFQPNVTGMPSEDSCGVGLEGRDFIRTLKNIGATSGVLEPGEQHPFTFCGGGVGNARGDSQTYNNSGAIYIHWKPQNATLTDQDSVIMVKSPYPGFEDQYGAQAMFSGDFSTLAVSAPKEDSCIFVADPLTPPFNVLPIRSPNACSDTGGNKNFLADDTVQNSGIVYIYNNPGADYKNLNSLQVLPETDITNQTPTNPTRRQTPVAQRLVDANPLALKAFNGDAWDEFGSTVVVSNDGNTIAVGAPGEDNCGTGIGGLGENHNIRLGGNPVCSGNSDRGPLNNEGLNSGAVYIYEKEAAPTASGFAWRRTAYIKAPNTDMEDQFGSALWFSSDGKTLVVGAPGEDNCGVLSGGTTHPGPSAVLPNQTDCGSTGQPGQFNNDALDSGAAYVYKNTNNGWDFVQYLKSSNSNRGDKFGSSISFGLAGSVRDDPIFAIGAPGEGGCGGGLHGETPNTSQKLGGIRFCNETGANSNALKNSGAVYFYLQSSNSALVNPVMLKAPVPGTNDRFGSSIFFTTFAGNQHTFIIGSPGDDNRADPKLHDQVNDLAMDSGSVFLYNTASHSLLEVGRLNSTNLNDPNPEYNALGSSLGSSATYEGKAIFFAGAPGYDGFHGSVSQDRIGRVLAIADTPEGFGSVGFLEAQPKTIKLSDGQIIFAPLTTTEFDYFGGEVSAGAQELGRTNASCDVLDTFTSVTNVIGAAKFLLCLGANFGAN